jgi:CHAD domain-containing protein
VRLDHLPFPEAWPALQPLLAALGAVRDLDVAHTESLPRLADVYVAGDPGRAEKWRRMQRRLGHAGAQLRSTLHGAIDNPATGQALIAITQWLEALSASPCDHDRAQGQPAGERDWAVRHMRSLRRKLREARKNTDGARRPHQMRILAKRLRYGIEVLRPLLPAQRARRWHHTATRLQADIGARRDALQAVDLVQGLRGHRPIAEFLRGHLTGMASACAQASHS